MTNKDSPKIIFEKCFPQKWGHNNGQIATPNINPTKGNKNNFDIFFIVFTIFLQ